MNIPIRKVEITVVSKKEIYYFLEGKSFIVTNLIEFEYYILN